MRWIHGVSGAFLAIVAVALAVAVSAALAGSAGLAATSPNLTFVAIAIRPNPHPTRTRILEHLRLLPGDHLRSIARTLRISLGEARYHLHVLHRGGLVHEDKVRHRARFYLTDTGSQAEKNAVFAKHWEHRDLRVRVLRAVESQGRAGPTQVARQMGISRQLATYYLGQLTALGQLTREARGFRAGPAAPRAAERGGPDLPPEIRP